MRVCAFLFLTFDLRTLIAEDGDKTDAAKKDGNKSDENKDAEKTDEKDKKDDDKPPEEQKDDKAEEETNAASSWYQNWWHVNQLGETESNVSWSSEIIRDLSEVNCFHCSNLCPKNGSTWGQDDGTQNQPDQPEQPDQPGRRSHLKSQGKGVFVVFVIKEVMVLYLGSTVSLPLNAQVDICTSF